MKISKTLLSKTAPKTYNLLSIGQRGVGKTVFLAGSYTELNAERQTDSQQLWFDCQDPKSQANLDSITSYINRTGQYPPATMKIAHFSFSLKHRKGKTEETLAHFQWTDIPGESCNLSDPEFQKLVLNSHGCCVFINADALLNDPAYLQELEQTTKQVLAIASLAYQHNLEYPIALVLTKCDLIENGPMRQLRIEENLQHLLTGLDSRKAIYKKFYTAIPLVSKQGVPVLGGLDTSAPFLWVVSELRKLNNLPIEQNFGSAIASEPPSPLWRQSRAVSIFGLNLSPKSLKYFIGTTLLLGLAGISAGLFFISNGRGAQQSQLPENMIRKYEEVLQKEPENFEALINLSKLLIQLEQYKRAIPLMEKLIQLRPDLTSLRLSLAHLYEFTDQNQKAEAAYDQVLAQQQNNLTALTSKALLRIQQGDTKTAKTLLNQAEKIAPTGELKAQIRKVAQEAFQGSAQSVPKPKLD